MRTPLVALADGAAVAERDVATARHPLWSAFAEGFGVMGANITSFVLFLPAAQDVGRAGLPLPAETLLLAVLVLITLLPAWLPPLLVMAAGRRGRRWLQQLNGVVCRHRRGINVVVAFAFAALLGWRGLTALTAL